MSSTPSQPRTSTILPSHPLPPTNRPPPKPHSNSSYSLISTSRNAPPSTIRPHHPATTSAATQQSDFPALRLASLHRLSATFANIYQRYARNFDGVADILDLETMKVMKDCGDLTRTVEDGVWEGEESEDEMDDIEFAPLITALAPKFTEGATILADDTDKAVIFRDQIRFVEESTGKAPIRRLSPVRVRKSPKELATQAVDFSRSDEDENSLINIANATKGEMRVAKAADSGKESLVKVVKHIKHLNHQSHLKRIDRVVQLERSSGNVRTESGEKILQRHPELIDKAGRLLHAKVNTSKKPSPPVGTDGIPLVRKTKRPSTSLDTAGLKKPKKSHHASGGPSIRMALPNGTGVPDKLCSRNVNQKVDNIPSLGPKAVTNIERILTEEIPYHIVVERSTPNIIIPSQVTELTQQARPSRRVLVADILDFNPSPVDGKPQDKDSPSPEEEAPVMGPIMEQTIHDPIEVIEIASDKTISRPASESPAHDVARTAEAVDTEASQEVEVPDVMSSLQDRPSSPTELVKQKVLASLLPASQQATEAPPWAHFATPLKHSKVTHLFQTPQRKSFVWRKPEI